MAKGTATITSLYCSACKKLNYTTRRNKKLKPKLDLTKFCNQCKEHLAHNAKDAK